MIKAPMLSGKFKDVDLGLQKLCVNFPEDKTFKRPLYATPKYDGIRALMIKDKGLVSRTFKPIPNRHMKSNVEAHLPWNVDGELVSGTFNETSGNVMRATGEPDFEYHIFDYVKDSLDKTYLERMKDLEKLEVPDFCVKVLPVKLSTLDELEAYERQCLDDGFEGIMLRDADGGYKCGRGTATKMDLMKVKRFKDAEAEIIGIDEEMHNDNEAEKDNFGRTKRSTSKENKTGKGSLGAIRVRGLNEEFKGVEFKIGTGFDQAMRDDMWRKRAKLIGKIVKYSYQHEGGTDRPRFPVFLGFRVKRDM